MTATNSSGFNGLVGRDNVLREMLVRDPDRARAAKTPGGSGVAGADLYGASPASHVQAEDRPLQVAGAGPAQMP